MQTKTITLSCDEVGFKVHSHFPKKEYQTLCSPDVWVHDFGKLRQKDQEFRASLGYLARHVGIKRKVKKKKKNIK